MDPEENEKKQDEKELGGLQKGMKTLSKKVKNTFGMIFRKIIATIVMPVVIKIIVVVLIVSIIINALTWIFKFFSDNTITDVASTNVIKSEVEIDLAEGDKGYYFKIDKDVVDTYLNELNDAYNKGYYQMEVDDEEREELENTVVDEEDYETRFTEDDMEDLFSTDDEELWNAYLVKMIKAEIASSYPKLGDYYGEDGTEDAEDNKKDTDENYVVQGVAEIHRTKMNDDGTVGEEIELTYLPHDELSALIQANDVEALDHFSFEESTGLIYYATYTKVVVTVNGSVVSTTYTLEEKSESYKKLTSMCSMPFNFLYALLEKTKDPEWVMTVIDLLLEDTELILMIQDQVDTTIETTVNYQVEKTESQTLTSETTSYRYGNEVSTKSSWVYGSVETSYAFPAGEREEIVTTTYRNTATVFIKKAKTWCMDFEQQATLTTVETYGEEVLSTYTDFSGLSYSLSYTNSGSIPSASRGSTFTIINKYLSNEKLLYSTKTDFIDRTWNISILTEKRINYERFLGTWKNDTGEYYQFSEYKEDGIEVKYNPPNSSRKTLVPATEICDASEQDIDLVVSLLQKHENTQMHEQLMMYYWNIYTGKDIYDVDLDALLDLFDTETMTSVSSGTIYGNSIEEKLWYALIDAGFSEYAAAGAMGNIYQESGLYTNNLQNSYESSLGMSDDEYTSAVDDGTYTNFSSDSAGYGLCQWTSSGRKAGLLAYAQSKGVSISDANTQIEYLLAELGVQNSASQYATYQLLSYNGYNADSWINAESVEDAAKAFCWSFERPGEPAMSNRISQAEYYYEKYHGQTRASYDVDTYDVESYSFPHYLQANYSGAYGTSTIKTSGCGPTSLAMILSGLLRDSSITPETVVANIAEYWPDGSYYISGIGSSHQIWSSSFLSKYYGVTSASCTESSAIQALLNGYCVIGGEDGHILAILPVSSEKQAEGYQFYILDSARGHSGYYKSVEDANKVVKGSLSFYAIIYP